MNNRPKKPSRPANTSCPSCQGQDLKLILSKKRQVFQCLSCDLTSATSEISNPASAPGTSAKWLKTYLSEKAFHRARFQKRLAEIEKRQSPGRILDVGCAAGIFLELAQEHDWQVFGVDTAKESINYCRKTFPSIPIFFGPLKEACLKRNSFDVVVVFDALEHLPNLQAFLAQVRRVLKQRGLLGVTVPNQRGLVSRLLGQSWFGYQKRQHLLFFTPKTLRVVLKKAGFKTIFEKKEFLWRCPLNNALAKLRKHYSLSLINRVSLLGEKLAQPLKIKTVIIPLEHIYVLAEKI